MHKRVFVFSGRELTFAISFPDEFLSLISVHRRLIESCLSFVGGVWWVLFSMVERLFRLCHWPRRRWMLAEEISEGIVGAVAAAYRCIHPRVCRRDTSAAARRSPWRARRAPCRSMGEIARRLWRPRCACPGEAFLPRRPSPVRRWCGSSRDLLSSPRTETARHRNASAALPTGY